MTSAQKLKDLITDIRKRLLDGIEDTHKIVMDLIKICFDKGYVNEAMNADKIRGRFDAFREKFTYNNPILKIYRKEELKILKEKKRYRGIILLLETFLIEGTFIQDQVKESLYLANQPNGQFEMARILENLVFKIKVLDESMEFYEKFLDEDLGKKTEDNIRAQLLGFFKDEEFDKMIHLVKREKIDKLEEKYMDETDLVDVDPEEFKEKFEDEEDFSEIVPDPDYQVQKNDSISENSIQTISKPLAVVQPITTPLPQPQPLKEVAPLSSDVSPVNSTTENQIVQPRVIPSPDDENIEAVSAVLAQKESHLSNFFRKNFGRSFHEEDVNTYILEQGNKYQEEGRSQEPLVGLYQDMLHDHPTWKISPKKFLKIMKVLAKTGLIARLEKLPSGYFMVHFHDISVTNDPTLVVELAKKHQGVLSKEDILDDLNWNEYRATIALEFLAKRGIARTDTGFIKGNRYYFVNI